MLLVAVVQPVELGRDDPERQCQQQDRELSPGMLRRSRRTTISFASRYARIRPAASAVSRARRTNQPRRRAGCRSAALRLPLEQRLRAPVEHEHVEVEPRRRSLLEGVHALRHLARGRLTPTRTFRTSPQHPLPVELRHSEAMAGSRPRPDQSRKTHRVRGASRSDGAASAHGPGPLRRPHPGRRRGSRPLPLRSARRRRSGHRPARPRRSRSTLARSTMVV